MFRSIVLPTLSLTLMGAAAAEPPPGNVSCKSKHFLAASAEGPKPVDPVLPANYPARASRYELPSELRFAREVDYPAKVAAITADLSVITASTLRHPDYDARYAGVAKSLNDMLKKTQGLLDGFARKDGAGLKDEQDAEFRAWYRQHGHWPRSLLADLDAAIAADIETTRQENAWREATHSELLKSARALYRYALARQRPDVQRDAGCQERALFFVKARLARLDQSFVPSVDQARYESALVRYARTNPKFHPQGLDGLLPGRRAVGALYKATELGDPAKRLAWLGKDPDAFRNSSDPFIQLAVRLQDAATALADRRREVDASLERVVPQYLAALMAWQKSQGKPAGPDPNATLRVTSAP